MKSSDLINKPYNYVKSKFTPYSKIFAYIYISYGAVSLVSFILSAATGPGQGRATILGSGAGSELLAYCMVAGMVFIPFALRWRYPKISLIPIMLVYIPVAFIWDLLNIFDLKNGEPSDFGFILFHTITLIPLTILAFGTLPKFFSSNSLLAKSIATAKSSSGQDHNVGYFEIKFKEHSNLFRNIYISYGAIIVSSIILSSANPERSRISFGGSDLLALSIMLGVVILPLVLRSLYRKISLIPIVLIFPPATFIWVFLNSSDAGDEADPLIGIVIFYSLTLFPAATYLLGTVPSISRSILKLLKHRGKSERI